MQTRIKHSKYRNSGILFELLIRQITSDLMYTKESKAINILKKYYTNTESAKELTLYTTLLKSKNLSEVKANALIDTVCEQSKKLDKKKLEKEKFNLIREIKKHYTLDDFFKAKIDNYKATAAIFTLLEASSTIEIANPEQIVSSKLTLLEYLQTANNEDPIILEFKNQDKEIKILSYKLLVEKFNEKYSTLTVEQREILSEYVNSISDTVKLKLFLNQKLQAAKDTLTTLVSNIDNTVTVIKLQEVIKNMHPISENQSIKDDHLLALMQYYALIKEIKNIK